MALIRIADVSPRDGLQNEPHSVATAHKVALVKRLFLCGLDEIEVSSFVSAKSIPQLGDAAEVFAALLALGRETLESGPMLSALVPNEKGMTAALEVNQRAGFALIKKVSVFTAASETFSKRNTNATIAESIERFKPVIAAARANALFVRGYISCAIACPLEGPIAPAKVHEVAGRLIAIGVDEIDLGDTIGAATPQTTRDLLEPILSRYTPSPTSHAVTQMLREVRLKVEKMLPKGKGSNGDSTSGADVPIRVENVLSATISDEEAAKFTTSAHAARFIRSNQPPANAFPITLHLHDTLGNAAACIAEALKMGLLSFDGSVGGLGGCPYASTPLKRAPGNINTELLVKTIENEGHTTKVNARNLAAAATLATRIIAEAGEPDPQL